MSEKEGVGVRIKKIRLNLDMSQKEFSETMEVTQSLLSMIENGRRCIHLYYSRSAG